MRNSLVFHYGKIEKESRIPLDLCSTKVSNISIHKVEREIDIVPDNYLKNICFSSGKSIDFDTHIFDTLSGAIYEPLTLLVFLFLWRIDCDQDRPNLFSTTKLAYEIGARKTQLENALERLSLLGLITYSESAIKEFKINKNWL